MNTASRSNIPSPTGKIGAHVRVFLMLKLKVHETRHRVMVIRMRLILAKSVVNDGCLNIDHVPLMIAHSSTPLFITDRVAYLHQATLLRTW
jgi:hypothetical protein